MEKNNIFINLIKIILVLWVSGKSVAMIGAMSTLVATTLTTILVACYTVTSWQLIWNSGTCPIFKLEQLERLHSEYTPRRPMITHIMDSYQIPCHNKTKSKQQI